MEEVELVKKKRNKTDEKEAKKSIINFRNVFVVVMCLLMIMLAITKIILLKSCISCYLLIILGIINLPLIYHKVFRKPWLTWVNFFVIFITLMATIMYTNYYGEWYSDEKDIKVEKEKIYINEQEYSYEEVLLSDVKRLIVESEEKQLVFHYWLDQNNNEIFLCQFENNQCIEFYQPKIKNVFYKYVGY